MMSPDTPAIQPGPPERRWINPDYLAGEYTPNSVGKPLAVAVGIDPLTPQLSAFVPSGPATPGVEI